MRDRPPSFEVGGEVPPEVRFWLERLNSLLDGPEASVQLAALGAAALPALRARLLFGAPASIYQPRQWAVEAVAAIGARDVLLEYLERDPSIPDPEVRQGEDAVRNTAARMVARWKSDDVFATLLRLADRRVLSGVVWALGEFRRAEALPHLERALEDDVARPTAEAVLLAWGAAGAAALAASSGRRDLRAGAERPASLRRRRSAVKILAAIGAGVRFWPRLRSLLDESDPELVVHAAKIGALAGAHDDQPHAVAALLRVLPRLPWYVEGDALTCLAALYPLDEGRIDAEIDRLTRLPRRGWGDERALSTLVRLRFRARGGRAEPAPET